MATAVRAAVNPHRSRSSATVRGNVTIEVRHQFRIVVKLMCRLFFIGLLSTFGLSQPLHGKPAAADPQQAQPVEVSNPAPDAMIRDRIMGIFPRSMNLKGSKSRFSLEW